MADATAPTLYTPPPDFQGRTDQINAAYKTALAKTQLQRSQLYTQAGFQDGTTNIDPTQQFGGIQELLHSTGAALNNDDLAALHRGLSGDSGLGAQAQAGDRYSELQGKNTIGNTVQQGVSELGNEDASALNQKNSDSLSNSNDESQYNAGNAYNIALASYLNQIANQNPDSATPGTTNANANFNSNPGGYNPGAPQNTGSGLASKPKAGKVTIAQGKTVGGRNV